MFYRPSRMEVNLAHLVSNYQAIQNFTGPSRQIIAVVKADGYGQGMLTIVRTLERAGCRRFAVATADEALFLRESGITASLLILGPTRPEEAGPMVRRGIAAALTDLDMLPFLSAAARRFNRPALCHLKVDTGMGRIGFLPSETLGVLEQFLAFPGLKLEGIFTHFATADCEGRSYMDKQFQRFLTALTQIRQYHPGPVLCHAANSAAILKAPETHLNACRPGMILYGLYPSHCPRPIELKPTFEVKTRIALIRELPAGSGISYGQTWHTEGPARIAVLPLGYADGLSRSLSGKMSVLIRGQRARQVGAICMDQMMVNVTGIAGAARGDEAVIVGAQGKERISAEELASLRPGTIVYEIPLMFSQRIPRIYTETPD